MNGLRDIVAMVNGKVNNFVWGLPMLVLLVGTGILMTVLTKGFQLSHFPGSGWRIPLAPFSKTST